MAILNMNLISRLSDGIWRLGCALSSGSFMSGIGGLYRAWLAEGLVKKQCVEEGEAIG